MPGRGEVEAHVEFGLDGRPAGHIIHGSQPGLSWLVWEVVEVWSMPYRERPCDARTPVEVDRYRVRVGGPLPGRPREYGNFVMVVRRYAHAPRTWWISPDPASPDFLLLSTLNCNEPAITRPGKLAPACARNGSR